MVSFAGEGIGHFGFPNQLAAKTFFPKLWTMKNKYFYSLFFFTCFSTFVSAQQPAHTNISIDSRLYEAFDSGYLEGLIAENPFLIHRWNYYLDNSWYITDLPAEKVEDSYPIIRIDDLKKINIFLVEKGQNLQRDWDRQQVYRIENTGKALVLLAGKTFTKKLNDYLER